MHIMGLRCERTEGMYLVHYRVQFVAEGGGFFVNPEVKIRVLLTRTALPPARLLAVHRNFST